MKNHLLFLCIALLFRCGSNPSIEPVSQDMIIDPVFAAIECTLCDGGNLIILDTVLGSYKYGVLNLALTLSLKADTCLVVDTVDVLGFVLIGSENERVIIARDSNNPNDRIMFRHLSRQVAPFINSVGCRFKNEKPDLNRLPARLSVNYLLRFAK